MRMAASSSATVFGGVRRGRSASAMRCQPRGARTCSRSSWPVLRIEQADEEVVPLHVDATTDPAGRRAVVRGLDFHAAIEMHRADAEAVIAKRLERQRAERGLLLGKHRGDLAFRRAVDARVGPVRFPAIEIRLRLLERLEAQPAQRRLLRVPDAGFDFALAIGIADATRQRDDAIVREHVAVERIERRVVDVRGEDAFLEIVEDDDAHRAAEPTKRPLVELGPDLRARVPHQQPDRFARVAERQDEEPRAPVLAGLRMAHHRAVAVIDLAFFAGRRGDHDARLGRATRRGASGRSAARSRTAR